MGARAQGPKVLLSANFLPGEEGLAPDHQIHIEEALISLGRAVFAAGGRLALRGHWPVANLLSLLAAEYLVPRDAETGDQIGRRDEAPTLGRGERPVTIYQSRVVEDVVPSQLAHLVELGVAELRWVSAEEERYNPNFPESRWPRSLARMRRQMIEEFEPAALVLLGGMEDEESDVMMFQELRRALPVFTVAATGGAARRVADRRRDRPQERVLRVMDQELNDRLEGRDIDLNDPRWARGGEAVFGEGSSIPAYPLLMQMIVADVLGERRRRE